MNYKKESQFTNNASKRVFEEVYTNEDMNDRSISGQSYRLNVPQMFANNPSQEKAVSPRRVMCEPSSHIFKLAVIYVAPPLWVTVFLMKEQLLLRQDHLLHKVKRYLCDQRLLYLFP